jgi:hypothetical protein
METKCPVSRRVAPEQTVSIPPNSDIAAPEPPRKLGVERAVPICDNVLYHI